MELLVVAIFIKTENIVRSSYGDGEYLSNDVDYGVGIKGKFVTESFNTLKGAFRKGQTEYLLVI